MDQKNSPPQATTNLQSAVNVFVNNITVNINGGIPRVHAEGLPGNHSAAEINLPNFPIVSNTVNSSSPQGTGGGQSSEENLSDHQTHPSPLTRSSSETLEPQSLQRVPPGGAVSPQSTRFQPDFSAAFQEGFPTRHVRSGNSRWVSYGSPLTSSQKKLICDEIDLGKVSMGVIASFIGHSKESIRRMRRRLREGLSSHNQAGRPPLLDQEREAKLRDVLNSKQEEKNSATVREAMGMVNRLARETEKARGKSPLSRHIADHKTIGKVLQSISAVKRKGQTTSNARAKASMDLRNFITMAAMNVAFSEGLSWHCIANMDATLLLLRFDSTESLIVFPCDDPPTRVETCVNDIFIKQMFLTSASGRLAPPLFIMADESLSAEDFKVHSIPGLSFSLECTASIGYILVCKNRHGNPAAQRWIFTEYMVKFAKDQRLLANQPNSEFYLVMDGEAIQSTTLDDEDVMKSVNAAHISIGKGPASCSGVCGNALDVGNAFKGIKTRLRHAPPLNEGRLADSELTDRISKIFLEFHGSLTSDKRKKLSAAIPRLLHHEMKTLNYETLMGGFERIGMIPSGESDWTPLDVTLSCCPKKNSLSPQDYLKIVHSFPSLVEIMKSEGQITESQMDRCGILRENVNGPSKVEKDALVQHRQRAVLLTLEASIRRRREYIAKRPKVKSPNAPPGQRKRGRPRKPNRFNDSIGDSQINPQQRNDRSLSSPPSLRPSPPPKRRKASRPKSQQKRSKMISKVLRSRRISLSSPPVRRRTP